MGLIGEPCYLIDDVLRCPSLHTSPRTLVRSWSCIGLTDLVWTVVSMRSREWM